MCPGTTWTYWDENLTVPMVLAFCDYWEIQPTERQLVAGIAMFCGWKPVEIGTINDLIASLPQETGSLNGE